MPKRVNDDIYNFSSPISDMSTDGRSTANAIVNELVKSYGAKVDADWGLSWSPSNIAEAFEESPVWTTLDYLTLAAPVAKWGVAAARVARGIGVGGAALKQGDIGLKAATKLEMRAPARTWLGRQFSNPVTHRVDDEYAAMMDKYGADPAEQRGLYDQLKSDLDINLQANQKLVSETIRTQQKLGPEDRAYLGKLLEEGAAPADLVGESDAITAFKNSWQLRNHLHDGALENGFITFSVWKKNLQTYMPRIYDEYMQSGIMDKYARLYGDADRAAASPFMSRVLSDEDSADLFTRIWDISTNTEKMGKALDTIAKQTFAKKLATSVIAKNQEEVAAGLIRFAEGRKFLGPNADFASVAVKPSTMEGLWDVAERNRLHIKSEVEPYFRDEGWMQTKDLINAKIPGFSDMPQELLDKWIDPAVVGDLSSMFTFMDQAPSNFLGRMLKSVYGHTLGTFRASKTAYNPAGHVRNFLGNTVFNSLATGRFKLAPVAGMKAMNESWKHGINDDFFEAIQAGVIGSSFTTEIKEAMVSMMDNIDWAKAAKLDSQSVTAIDWFGDSALARLARKTAGKAEDVYRLTDEVWKLDAFITNKAKFVRKIAKERGLDPADVLAYGKTTITPDMDDTARALRGAYDDALGRAQLAVQKFMPQFSTHSPLGDMLRKGVPFASFSTEALRIWRNALVERPLQAFAWQHMAETASYGIGNAMGMSMDEVDQTQESLAHFQRTKKNLLLPFRVDGKANYLDLSYIIPLANVDEATDVENVFFGGLFNPTSNPLLNWTAAAATGVDPFSKRPIEPRFTESALGTTLTDDPAARTAFGMFEHMAVTMVPPLLPPGYSAANLMEMVRGDINPSTGQPYEPDYAKTLAANLAGLRTYDATIVSQLQNIQKEQLDIGKRSQVWLDRYKRDRANGNPAGMNEALENIKTVQADMGKTPDEIQSYITNMVKRTEPGKFRNVSARMLEQVLQRSGQMPRPLSRADREALAELTARSHERRKKRKYKRRRRSSR